MSLAARGPSPAPSKERHWLLGLSISLPLKGAWGCLSRVFTRTRVRSLFPSRWCTLVCPKSRALPHLFPPVPMLNGTGHTVQVCVPACTCERQFTPCTPAQSHTYLFHTHLPTQPRLSTPATPVTQWVSARPPGPLVCATPAHTCHPCLTPCSHLLISRDLSARGGLGALRLKVRLAEDRVLPSRCYQPLMALLLESVRGPPEVGVAGQAAGFCLGPGTPGHPMLLSLLRRTLPAPWLCWRS